MTPGTEELRRRANEVRRQADCLEAAASLRELADEAQRHSHYATQLDVAKELLDKLADLVDERTKLTHSDYLRVLVVWMREKANQSERDAAAPVDGDAVADSVPGELSPFEQFVASQDEGTSIYFTAAAAAEVAEAMTFRRSSALTGDRELEFDGDALAAICREWVAQERRAGNRHVDEGPPAAAGGDALLDDEPGTLDGVSFAATASQAMTIREAIALRWELLEIPPANQSVGETLAAICGYWRKTMERKETPVSAEPPALAHVPLPTLAINPNEVCVGPSFGPPTVDEAWLPPVGSNGFREFGDKSAIKPAPFHPGRFFATGPNGEVIRDSDASHSATTFPTEQSAAVAMLARGWCQAAGKVN